MAGYNVTRNVEELLAEHESSPPSFTVHLHPDHWTLNGGSKFLYNNQIASLLDDVRAQRIPTDFLELFDAAKLPFYDGCMIVELLDYRPLKGKEPELSTPKRSRVVLNPTPETLWADICLLSHKAGDVWTDEDALHVEAKILMSTAPPLCLDPDPHLTRIANSILRVSVPPAPASLKRKAVAMEPEEDESEKTRRAKIMQYMNPRINRLPVPRYHILQMLERMRQRPPVPPPATIASGQVMPPGIAPPTQLVIPSSYPLGVRATPAPPAHPTPAPSSYPTASTPLLAPTAPARNSVTPSPQIVMSPSTKPAKTPEVKKPPTQSPVVNTRPPSAIPTAAAIPPHMQHYQAARSTPSPPSHVPRPASAVASARSPLPSERPLSAVQPAAAPGIHLQPQPIPQVRGKTPMPQHSPSPRVQPAQAPVLQAPTHHPQPQMQPAPPQTVSSQNVPMQQPILQNGNAAGMIPNIAARRKTPQQVNPTAQQPPQLGSMNAAGQMNPALNPAIYQYLIKQQQMNQFNASQAATQASQALNAQLPQRSSPAGRAQQPTPRPTVNTQPTASHPQQGNFNYAALQSHLNNGNLRPVVHGSHAQLIQHQQQFPGGAQPAGATQQGAQVAQDHTHMQNAAQFMSQYQQVYYGQPGVNMQMQQPLLPQGYQWSMGMGRGVVPNISGHPQQMQLGAGKAGVQGSS